MASLFFQCFSKNPCRSLLPFLATASHNMTAFPMHEFQTTRPFHPRRRFHGLSAKRRVHGLSAKRREAQAAQKARTTSSILRGADRTPPPPLSRLHTQTRRKRTCRAWVRRRRWGPCRPPRSPLSLPERCGGAAEGTPRCTRAGCAGVSFVGGRDIGVV